MRYCLLQPVSMNGQSWCGNSWGSTIKRRSTPMPRRGITFWMKYWKNWWGLGNRSLWWLKILITSINRSTSNPGTRTEASETTRSTTSTATLQRSDAVTAPSKNQNFSSSHTRPMPSSWKCRVGCTVPFVKAHSHLIFSSTTSLVARSSNILKLSPNCFKRQICWLLLARPFCRGWRVRLSRLQRKGKRTSSKSAKIASSKRATRYGWTHSLCLL